MDLISLKIKCKNVRMDIIKMITLANSGHPGGSLSAVEMIVGLYYTSMYINPKNPQDQNRDRFILSKGHAAPCLYAVLADLGFFPKSELANFRKIHSILQGHPDSKKTPGVDASTGSLGQGVSIATGMALASKMLSNSVKVFCMLGDGELQEGLVWEACMAASHYKLDNLTVLIDLNGLQLDGRTEQVMDLGNLKDKFTAFGFDVYEIKDGNEIEQVLSAFAVGGVRDKPRCIIAHTVKGKGVSFMENQVGWHGSGISHQECELALRELGSVVYE